MAIRGSRANSGLRRFPAATGSITIWSPSGPRIYGSTGGDCNAASVASISSGEGAAVGAAATAAGAAACAIKWGRSRIASSNARLVSACSGAYLGLYALFWAICPKFSSAVVLGYPESSSASPLSGIACNSAYACLYRGELVSANIGTWLLGREAYSLASSGFIPAHRGSRPVELSRSIWACSGFVLRNWLYEVRTSHVFTRGSSPCAAPILSIGIS